MSWFFSHFSFPMRWLVHGKNCIGILQSFFLPKFWHLGRNCRNVALLIIPDVPLINFFFSLIWGFYHYQLKHQFQYDENHYKLNRFLNLLQSFLKIKSSAILWITIFIIFSLIRIKICKRFSQLSCAGNIFPFETH